MIGVVITTLVDPVYIIEFGDLILYSLVFVFPFISG